ncbi:MULTISPECIES: tetratricopeptide repeat protein [Limnospira]|uniref:Tetratricopeptide repeat protein n=1 Tax=Limnospira fusiformis PMC 851.14 TaxID=2219512 RepID=A0ABU9ETM6_LIMFS|nr:tetratricopeptide repeat protein [Limnospira sp. PMC 917.15]MDT9234645.1 tetratricopeptide repeat protein [Limnospira sp. PMC 917.15]
MRSSQGMSAGELLRQANQLKRSGKLDEAIALYHQVIDINPHFAWAYHGLGDAWAKQGNLDEAVAWYSECLKIHPDSAWLYYSLGEVLAELGDLEAAVDYLQKAIDIKPDFHKFYHRLSILLRLKNKIPEAINNYKIALEIHPNLSYLNNQELLDYAQLASNQYDWFMAIRLWTIALEKQGTNASVMIYYQLSCAYRKIRALDTAQAIVSSGIIKYPNEILLHRELYEILISKRNNHEAILCIQDLLVKHNKHDSVAQEYRDKMLSLLLYNKIWLYSLMKSGTTYTLMVLANYIARISGANKDIDFDSMKNYGIIHGLNVYELLKDKTMIEYLLNLKTDWQIYHTHIYVEADFKKVIMLTRNPLDFIISSYFFHFKNRGKDQELHEVIDSRLKHFCTTYLCQKKLSRDYPEDSILIKYEDLITETHTVFTKIIHHLNLDFNDNLLQLSIDACSVSKVKNMEQRYGKPLVVGEKLKVKSFIRSGKIGEWKDFFNDIDLKYIGKKLMENGVNPNDFQEFDCFF